MSLLQQTLDQFEADERLELAPEMEGSPLVKAMAKLLTILLAKMEKDDDGLPKPEVNPENKLKKVVPYIS